MKTAKKKRARSSPLELVLPATSANLGPAFDAAALAFGLFLKIRASPADEFFITARGRDAEICGRVENHLILTTYREVLQEAGKPVRPLTLDIDNQIPIGKGCGSSAAARRGTIGARVRCGRLGWEGRPDGGRSMEADPPPRKRGGLRDGWSGGGENV